MIWFEVTRNGGVIIIVS